MIPHIVHQTWRSNALSEPCRSYCNSWKQLNPDCEYRFYDDADCLAFVRTEFRHIANMYEALPLAILRADLFRYLVVYRLGGLYADIDMQCLKPFGRFFSLNGAVFSIESRLTATRQRELGYRRPYQIANCIFASEAGHPFVASIIDRVVSLIKAQGSIERTAVEDVTGPRMLTRLFYEQMPPNVHVLRQIHWLPYRGYPRVFPLNANMFAWHHFVGSWKDSAAGPASPRRRWIERDIPPNPFPSHSIQRFDDN